jgi:hypothetical protein
VWADAHPKEAKPDPLRAAPDPSSAGALDGLERVLAEFDRARVRLEGEQPPAG